MNVGARTGMRWTALLVLWPLTWGCQRKALQGGGPLRTVDSGLAAHDSVVNPFKEIAPGVFSRTMYRTAASLVPSVEVRDVEVAANKAAGALAFPGAAVVEVRSGTGSLRLASKSQDVRPGRTYGLSQGDSLQVTNKASEPLSLRVYVIGSSR